MRKNIPDPELDAVDLALLQLVQQDGSLSNTELADRLNLSVTPCWRRRKRLEEAGYITGYQAQLSRRRLGYQVLAYVQIRFGGHADEAPDRFEALIRALPEVQACHKITGEYDYLLQVLAQDLDAYADFLERTLRRQPGITAIHSALALREVKAGTQVPVGPSGQGPSASPPGRRDR